MLVLLLYSTSSFRYLSLVVRFVKCEFREPRPANDEQRANGTWTLVLETVVIVQRRTNR